MQILNGNNLDLLKTLADNSVDSIVTDPPYGLSFMNNKWDYDVPSVELWKEVYRVLKHGGHVVSFGGTRTYHRMVVNIEDAGFEIRDQIMWLYGSGFPKSHNIGKAIDAIEKTGKSNPKALREARMGDEYEPTGQIDYAKGRMFSSEIKNDNTQLNITNAWEGWGTALKPAHEDLVLARKPFQFSSDFIYLYENIVYKLKIQICQSKLFAKDAEKIFMSSQKESNEVKLDFAQWSVEKPFNSKEDLLVLMDMLQLELMEGNTTLNIVLLWLNILADLWNVLNTYITETESNTIIELRILNSLEWESIFQNITLLKDNKTNGLIANVLTAESIFSVLNLKLSDILTHSAKESATLKGEEKNFAPNSNPICLARKPLSEKSVAENVLKHGTGGIHIDGCRVGSENRTYKGSGKQPNKLNNHGKGATGIGYMDGSGSDLEYSVNGRFPANVIHDGSEEVLEGFPNTGNGNGGKPYNYSGKEYDNKKTSMFNGDKPQAPSNFNDSGNASRFFYCAKASKSDRSDGNNHPTVKPTELMRYLCRLITPPNGIVLDPFMGSGSTGKGAILEGFDFIGMELDPEYVEIAKARIEHAQKEYSENQAQQKLF
jgi:DNA modification methylase